MRDAYAAITDSIIAALERGTVPWRKPWKGGPVRAPRNLHSGKAYRGINTLVLMSAGRDSPFWLTFKQAKTLGGYVRKGERGTPIVFWRFLDRIETDDDTGEQRPRKVPMAKLYTVFNAEQCEGLDRLIPGESIMRPSFDPIEAAQRIVDGWGAKPEIRHGGGRACYWPGVDKIDMPRPERFTGREEYYSTLFHELGHSTGHESRLNREEMARILAFGDHSYSREELVAELCAAFLCGEAGISAPVIENQAAYIAGWLRKLRDDRRLVLQAAGHAQHAADLILGKQEG